MSKRRNVFRRRPRNGAPGSPHAVDRIPLTPEGLPAAVPDAPRVSPVVFVTDESRERYPWLPARVIAWSVWPGPNHVRVQIDESGNALERGATRLLPRVA